MSKSWIARLCALGILACAAATSFASIQDGSIVINHALNSPTLNVHYSGAHVSMVELLLNGSSIGTRSVDAAGDKGDTSFTIDLASLNSGDNDVEVRLYDKDGKLVGTQTGSVSSDQAPKSPVFLQMPKLGSTVQGPVQVNVGFGKDLRNTYVSFFVDNQFKSMTNSPPFSYIWDTTRDSNGWHELEAWVVDDSSNTFKTPRIKVFVNNPGGNTVRQFNQPNVATAVVTPKVAPATTPKVAPAATSPNTTPALTPSTTAPTVAVQSQTPAIKSATLAATKAIQATSALAPAATLKVATRTAAPTIAISNAVITDIGPSDGVRAIPLAEPVASGPRLLLPTFKRVAENSPTPVAKAVLNGPIPSTPKARAIIATHPQATLSAMPRGIKLTPLPKVVSTALITRPSAPIASKAEVVAAKATPKAVESTPKVTHAFLAANAGVAHVQVPKTIAITRGTKLPNVGTFDISLNAKQVQFDNVKPRVQDNVPLTPFRYLFEQDGGKVNWHNPTKTVTANGVGKDIYIKIGDKLAKVNNLPIQLDLTPFIDHGRTIVPLSFIQQALDVEVDYDPVTNHVLITSIKKKH